MFGFLTHDKRYTLFATETEVFLADVKKTTEGQARVELIANREKSADDPLNLSSLAAGTGRKKAKIALVLPLNDFELVSVTVPPVSREAVTKMLPYSLSKILPSPVDEYIYDWQVAQDFKDRQELTVYLYSAPKYQQYRHELLMRQKEITWFEPDVFAACSYLNSRKDTMAESAFLVLLAWQNSVSIAVYDEQRISLVRAVEVTMPKGRPAELELEEEDNATMIASVGERVESAGKQPFDGESDSFDFLAGFGLQTDETASAEKTTDNEEGRIQSVPITPIADPWVDYLDNLYLEIMRTGDYHTSVLKGKPIRQVFIGGAEHFYQAMAKTARVEQHLNVTRFPPDEIIAGCSPTIAAICLGALQR